MESSTFKKPTSKCHLAKNVWFVAKHWSQEMPFRLMTLIAISRWSCLVKQIFFHPGHLCRRRCLCSNAKTIPKWFRELSSSSKLGCMLWHGPNWYLKSLSVEKIANSTLHMADFLSRILCSIPNRSQRMTPVLKIRPINFIKLKSFKYSKLACCNKFHFVITRRHKKGGRKRIPFFYIYYKEYCTRLFFQYDFMFIASLIPPFLSSSLPHPPQYYKGADDEQKNVQDVKKGVVYFLLLATLK